MGFMETIGKVKAIFTGKKEQKKEEVTHQRADAMDAAIDAYKVQMEFSKEKEQRAAVVGIDMAAGEDMTAEVREVPKQITEEEAIREIAEKYGLTVEEAMKRWKSVQEAMQKAFDSVKETIEHIAEALSPVLQVFIKKSYKDVCNQKKKEIPNNVRRRKKMPMIRTQAYLKNLKNSRKRKR